MDFDITPEEHTGGAWYTDENSTKNSCPVYAQ